MNKYSLGRKNNKEIILSFEGEEISSDGGLVLIDKIDTKLKLIDKVANNIVDTRQPSKIKHKAKNLLKQRIYALISGYEDLNDHDTLRHDNFYKQLIGTQKALASSSTLSRIESAACLDNNVENQKLLVESFIDSYDKAPDSIVLDFDPTDITLYGHQEGRSYHGYYKDYCYLPLIVTCNDHILTAYLRPSNIDGAKHVWAVLSLIVKRIRKSWPDTKITFRADSGLCRHKILNWCERNSISYIVGLSGNNKLNEMSLPLHEHVKSEFNKTTMPQKMYASFSYAANTWKRQRKVIVKCEYNAIGSNTRYVVTNIDGDDKDLYTGIYCKRGDMENRVKEIQLDMFGDRLSSSSFATNQLRLFLSAIAYTYMNYLKAIILKTSKIKHYCKTIRLKIIKVSAVIRKNTRRVYINLAKNYPYKHLFTKVFNHLYSLE